MGSIFLVRNLWVLAKMSGIGDLSDFVEIWDLDYSDFGPKAQKNFGFPTQSVDFSW